jgi:predicted HD superfamily hydrolase involved in NAD metabolism
MGQSPDLHETVDAFLRANGYSHTAAHSQMVAYNAREIADRFQVPTVKAFQAGWLHDVSAVIPVNRRLAVAQDWGVPIVAEERTFPLIIHQKLSVVIAREVMDVRDEEVLSAIGCHTTLRPKAGMLDKVLFIADKIQWDQSGEPPYRADLVRALDSSLDEAVFFFLNYLWMRRSELAVVHPWLSQAYHESVARKLALGS